MMISKRWGVTKKLRSIELLIMDCDGTLTNGQLPEKQFDVKDGYGLKNLQIKKAIISGDFSELVKARANHLGIDYVYLGVHDKLFVMQLLVKLLGLTQDQVCYVGDDVNDLACIMWAGLGIAVNDSHKVVKQYANYVTRAKGGCGAIREVCDMITDNKR